MEQLLATAWCPACRPRSLRRQDALAQTSSDGKTAQRAERSQMGFAIVTLLVLLLGAFVPPARGVPMCLIINGGTVGGSRYCTGRLKVILSRLCPFTRSASFTDRYKNLGCKSLVCAWGVLQPFSV